VYNGYNEYLVDFAVTTQFTLPM